MKSLTELGTSEDGCVYGLNGGYIVVVFACRGGPDTLYYTDNREEAFDKIGIRDPDIEEEPLQLELHEGDNLYDIMCEHETLSWSWPRLRKYMEEHGFYKDDKWIIRKK